MVTLAQRIAQLRTERGLSRPQLSAALGLPKTAVEKFELGRQTPTQEQQERLAAFFGVSLFYLRGESSDRTRMENWMDDPGYDAPTAPPSAAPKARSAPAPSGGEGSVLEALLTGKRFQEALRTAVLEALRSPEGQAIIEKAVRRELIGRGQKGQKE